MDIVIFSLKMHIANVKRNKCPTEKTSKKQIEQSMKSVFRETISVLIEESSNLY